MSSVTVENLRLDLDVGNGWTAFEGKLGGAGPLGSVVFRHVDRASVTSGIDLDKRVLLGAEIVVRPEDVHAIVDRMNDRRRELLVMLMSKALPKR